MANEKELNLEIPEEKEEKEQSDGTLKALSEEDIENLSSIHLEDEMKALYSNMMRFHEELDFITKPSPAFPILRQKSYAKIFQMIQADPGFLPEEALHRFYYDLGHVISLMLEINTTALIVRLKQFNLYDPTLFKEMRKKVNQKEKERRATKHGSSAQGN